MSAFAESLGIKFDFFFTFICWGLIFTRIFVMLILNPFLGSRVVPGRMRLMLSVFISIFLYPLIVPPLKDSFPHDYSLLAALFFKEAFFGFTIGLITVMTFHAIESAGRIVDDQRGGANAQLFAPQLGQVSLFGLYYFWLAIAFFVSVGGHRLFLKAFLLSFQTIPLLELPHIAPGFSPFLQLVVHLSGSVLITAIQLSAPVLIAIFLVDTVLGIANKMAPQINVFELGFAIKGYVAPMMIYVSVLILVTQMDDIMNGMIKSVYEITSLFAR